MIGISKLYCGAVEPADVLRYNRHSGKLPSHLLQFSADKKPVVVWNMTRRCNLKCIHCYSNSDNINYPDELTTEEGKKLIDDLASFGSPVILFPAASRFCVRIYWSWRNTQQIKECGRSFPPTARSLPKRSRPNSRR